jgi:hypothetical protein
VRWPGERERAGRAPPGSLLNVSGGSSPRVARCASHPPRGAERTVRRRGHRRGRGHRRRGGRLRPLPHADSGRKARDEAPGAPEKGGNNQGAGDQASSGRPATPMRPTGFPESSNDPGLGRPAERRHESISGAGRSLGRHGRDREGNDPDDHDPGRQPPVATPAASWRRCRCGRSLVDPAFPIPEHKSGSIRQPG